MSGTHTERTDEHNAGESDDRVVRSINTQTVTHLNTIGCAFIKCCIRVGRQLELNDGGESWWLAGGRVGGVEVLRLIPRWQVQCVNNEGREGKFACSRHLSKVYQAGTPIFHHRNNAVKRTHMIVSS